MYQRLLGEMSDLRQGNRRRIRKGLWALVGVTVGLLALVFISQSSKVIFLLLWIVSMFGVAAYLIGVEYMDYQMQHKVGHIANMRDGELSEILTLPESSPKSRLAARLRREADALEGVETPEPEASAPAVFDLPRSLMDLEPLEDPEPEQPEPEVLAAEPQPAPETVTEAAPADESAVGSRAASYVPSRLAVEAPRARRAAQPSRTRRANRAQAAAADEDYSLENILAEYGGDGAAAKPQPAPQPVKPAEPEPKPQPQPAASTALAPRTAPLDLGQLMQEPQRMSRVAHDLSLLSQALQGLSEDLWQQGEEGRK